MSKPQVRVVRANETAFLLREQVPAGPGTPVLLLHGVPETSSCWRDLAPALAVGRRVLAPDLPGLGGSTFTGPYDAATLAAQLATLVEAEVPGGRVDVVGHDWGGVLALQLATDRPDLVRRLVVANAPWRVLPFLRAAHVPFFALPLAPELLFKVGGRRLVDLMLSAGWKAPGRLDDERRSEYAAAYGASDQIEAMLGYYRAATRPKMMAAFRRERRPAILPINVEKALVLWGAADPVLPVRIGEGVTRDLGPDAVMVTIPGAGHFVLEEAPDVVAAVLLDFLAEDTGIEQTPRVSP